MAFEHDGTRDTARRYGQLVARSWTDPAFKQRLLNAPTPVLQESGFSVPDGVVVRVVETRSAPDTGAVRYLVLPTSPSEGLMIEPLGGRPAARAITETARPSQSPNETARPQTTETAPPPAPNETAGPSQETAPPPSNETAAPPQETAPPSSETARPAQETARPAQETARPQAHG